MWVRFHEGKAFSSTLALLDDFGNHVRFGVPGEELVLENDLAAFNLLWNSLSSLMNFDNQDRQCWVPRLFYDATFTVPLPTLIVEQLATASQVEAREARKGEYKPHFM